MSIIEAVVLGLVQGLAEFLPVSSDGHLTLLAHLFGLDVAARLPFTVTLHAATAVSMLVFFAPTWGRLTRDLWARDPAARQGSRKTVGYIVLASVPAGAVGLLMGETIEVALASPVWVGVMFLVSGGILFGTRFAVGQHAKLNWWRALLVGLAQAVGIVPAISRSGATISAGIYLGLDRRSAFEFSFLLALPAIIGAFLHQVRNLDLALVPPAPLAAGLAVAFVSGLGALYALRSVVLGRKLHWFAYYCWAVGLACLLFVR